MNEEVTNEKNIYPNTENVTEETQCEQQIDDSEICITTEVQKLYPVNTNPNREGIYFHMNFMNYCDILASKSYFY